LGTIPLGRSAEPEVMSYSYLSLEWKEKACVWNHHYETIVISKEKDLIHQTMLEEKWKLR
jgi:hypothetical protein